MKLTKTATLIFSVFIFLAAAYPAGAMPVIDGVLEWDEGYETGNWVYFTAGKGKKETQLADRGKLWTYREDYTGDLYVNLTLPVSLVDNVYGNDTKGWGRKNKRHRFRDLEKSDSARFTITNLSNKVVLDFTLDYLSRDKKNKYSSSGAGGRDGKIHSGSADSLLDWGTSLDYNFNELGYVLTKNSPSAKDLKSSSPKYSGWRNEVTYEFRIDGDILGNHALIDVGIPYLHISPNKVGGNTVFATVGETIPEPATICLLGLGSLCLLRKRRHRKVI